MTEEDLERAISEASNHVFVPVIISRLRECFDGLYVPTKLKKSAGRQTPIPAEWTDNVRDLRLDMHLSAEYLSEGCQGFLSDNILTMANKISEAFHQSQGKAIYIRQMPTLKRMTHENFFCHLVGRIVYVVFSASDVEKYTNVGLVVPLSGGKRND